MDAFDRVHIPRSPLIPRADEHQIPTDRVRAVFFHKLIGIDDVAAAFRHLLAIWSQNHALVEQAQHGFVKVYNAQIAQRLGEETCVEQMHGRVFDATRVLINRQPVVAFRLVPGDVVGFQRFAGLPVRRDIRVLVPARTHEGVHGVCLALGIATALWALHITEARVVAQWALARGPKLGVIGQQHRQIFVGYGHGRRSFRSK